MKIEIILPDWVDERDIFITAGCELVAFNLAFDRNWKIKSSRCNQCGECCKNLPKGHYYPLNEDGSCSKLIPDGEKLVCSLGVERPLPCVIGEPSMRSYWDKCCIRYNGE